MITIREYSEIAFDHRGHPTQLAKEPCLRKRTISAGDSVTLHSKTKYFMVSADEAFLWDCNTSAAVDADAGTLFPGAGLYLSVDPGTGMVFETAAA